MTTVVPVGAEPVSPSTVPQSEDPRYDVLRRRLFAAHLGITVAGAAIAATAWAAYGWGVVVAVVALCVGPIGAVRFATRRLLFGRCCFTTGLTALSTHFRAAVALVLLSPLLMASAGASLYLGGGPAPFVVGCVAAVLLLFPSAVAAAIWTRALDATVGEVCTDGTPTGTIGGEFVVDGAPSPTPPSSIEEEHIQPLPPLSLYASSSPTGYVLEVESCDDAPHRSRSPLGYRFRSSVFGDGRRSSADPHSLGHLQLFPRTVHIDVAVASDAG